MQFQKTIPLEEINNYSLSNTNILNILNNICIIKNKKNINYDKNEIKKKETLNKSDFFKPKYKNTLFWCWFIYNNGYKDYEFSIDNGFRVEEEYKIKMVELVRTNKKLLSLHRLKIGEIENNILYEMLSIQSMLALILIKNVNLFYIDNKVFYQKIMNDDDEYCIICKNDDGTFSLWNNTKKFPLYIYKNSLLEIVNLKKPLKGLSAYKVDDLVQMCLKLKHTIMNDNGKRKTKKELYMLISADLN